MGVFTFTYAEGFSCLSDDPRACANCHVMREVFSGASDVDLTKARQLHRKADMRWDFVSAENSVGFHSPQQTARILAVAIDLARQAQLEAEHVTVAR